MELDRRCGRDKKAGTRLLKRCARARTRSRSRGESRSALRNWYTLSALRVIPRLRPMWKRPTCFNQKMSSEWHPECDLSSVIVIAFIRILKNSFVAIKDETWSSIFTSTLKSAFFRSVESTFQKIFEKPRTWLDRPAFIDVQRSENCGAWRESTLVTDDTGKDDGS